MIVRGKEFFARLKETISSWRNPQQEVRPSACDSFLSVTRTLAQRLDIFTNPLFNDDIERDLFVASLAKEVFFGIFPLGMSPQDSLNGKMNRINYRTSSEIRDSIFAIIDNPTVSYPKKGPIQQAAKSVFGTLRSDLTRMGFNFLFVQEYLSAISNGSQSLTYEPRTEMKEDVERCLRVWLI